MSWLRIISAVLTIIPSIIKVMFAVEAVMPAGSGKEKLAAVTGIIEATHAESAEILPAVEKSVGVLARVFNDSGVFKKVAQ